LPPSTRQAGLDRASSPHRPARALSTSEEIVCMPRPPVWWTWPAPGDWLGCPIFGSQLLRCIWRDRAERGIDTTLVGANPSTLIPGCCRCARERRRRGRRGRHQPPVNCASAPGPAEESSMGARSRASPSRLTSGFFLELWRTFPAYPFRSILPTMSRKGCGTPGKQFQTRGMGAGPPCLPCSQPCCACPWRDGNQVKPR